MHPPAAIAPFRLWDDAGNLLREFGRSDFNCQTATFSPDATEILTTSSSSVIVWALDGSELRRYVSADGEVKDAFYTPDGIRIIERAKDQDTTRLRHLDGTIVQVLRSPLPAVRSRSEPRRVVVPACPGQCGRGVARTPDGRLFLLEQDAGDISVIRHTGEEAFQLEGDGLELELAQFSQSPHALLLVSDRAPRIVLLDERLLRDRCSKIVPRSFRPEEWAYFSRLLKEPEPDAGGE